MFRLLPYAEISYYVIKLCVAIYTRTKKKRTGQHIFFRKITSEERICVEEFEGMLVTAVRAAYMYLQPEVKTCFHHTRFSAFLWFYSVTTLIVEVTIFKF